MGWEMRIARCVLPFLSSQHKETLIKGKDRSTARNSRKRRIWLRRSIWHSIGSTWAVRDGCVFSFLPFSLLCPVCLTPSPILPCSLDTQEFRTASHRVTVVFETVRPALFSSLFPPSLSSLSVPSFFSLTDTLSLSLRLQEALAAYESQFPTSRR
jgi:hypothetical protein